MFYPTQELSHFRINISEAVGKLINLDDDKKRKHLISIRRNVKKSLKDIRLHVLELNDTIKINSKRYCVNDNKQNIFDIVLYSLNTLETYLDAASKDEDNYDINTVIMSLDAVSNHIRTLMLKINGLGISGYSYLETDYYSYYILDMPYRCIDVLNDLMPEEYIAPRDFSILYQYNSSYPYRLTSSLKRDNPQRRLYAYSNMQPTKEDRMMMDKVAVSEASANDCIISNTSFDVVLCSPTVTTDIVLSSGDEQKISEIEELKRVSQYVRLNGYLIVDIPYFRLNNKMINLLSKQFEVCKAYKVKEENESLLPISVVLVLRRLFQREDEEINKTKEDFEYIIKKYRPSDDGLILNKSDITIEDSFIDIKTFRGTLPDIAAFEVIAETSSLYANILDEYTGKNDVQRDMQPILPLTAGQCGLALASGVIDGVIEEENGYKHIIKGNVFKTNITKNTINYSTSMSQEDTITTEVTTTNTIEINVMTGDGTFKRLGADKVKEGVDKPIWEEVGVPLFNRGLNVQDFAPVDN